MLTAPAPPCWRSPMPRIPPKGWALKSSLPLTAQRKALQLTFDKQSKTAVSQADENGDIAFNFIADLKSDSSLDVTAGNINATANIDIVYE